MKKLPTVSIVIPAFNEEGNISLLLTDLLLQTSKSYGLEQIVIISDKSTDNTVSNAKSVVSKLIQVIELKKRQGKAKAVNSFFSRAKTDIVVQLDADIRIRDERCLELLLQPIIEEGVSLTSAQVMEIESKNIFQAVLQTSMQVKKNIFREHRQGNNLFTCHGRARAFAKNLYKNINFPVSAGEDAYSFFYCKANNLKYQYVDSAKVFYSLPANFYDHLLQSSRYFNHDNQIASYFDDSVYANEYSLPISLTVKHIALNILRKPLHMFFYAGIVCICKIYSAFSREHGNTWSVSQSSKIT